MVFGWREVHQTQYAAEAADALYQCGICREADEFPSRGEQVQHDTEDRIVAAELLRLRGCLLLANDQVQVPLQHLSGDSAEFMRREAG
jgi:hypothetical protein